MTSEVLSAALERLERGERVALGTVVTTRGSTPQKVGARVLVGGTERLLGTLGGGAVEAEAVREAARALVEERPALREYVLSTGTDDWGLACGGTMVVFVEPLGPRAVGWLRAVREAAAGGEPLGLVTVVAGARSGARVLVREQETTGALGDATLDAEAVALGRRVLAREGAELGSVGEVSLYAEAFGPPPALVIVGAGHVGKALAGLGRFLGVRVTVIDDRLEYASRERFPEADQVIAAPAGQAVRDLGLHPGTAVVVAMRNQDLDYEATAAALRTPARYVGLIGARRKAILVAERLLADGMPAERVRELRAPIGLDIGARTPEEIALSIAAEWILLRQGGSGAPLRLGDDLLAKAAARARGA